MKGRLLLRSGSGKCHAAPAFWHTISILTRQHVGKTLVLWYMVHQQNAMQPIRAYSKLLLLWIHGKCKVGSTTPVRQLFEKRIHFKMGIRLQLESFSAVNAEIVQITILHFCLFGQLSILKLATPTIMTLWTKRTLFSFWMAGHEAKNKVGR